MDIQRIEDGDKITLALSGRLDTISAPVLQQILEKEFKVAKSVILDFKEIAYVSSAGLRVLLIGEKAAKSGGIKQVLVNVSPEVMEVFNMTGFSDVLNIE